MPLPGIRRLLLSKETRMPGACRLVAGQTLPRPSQMESPGASRYQQKACQYPPAFAYAAVSETYAGRESASGVRFPHPALTLSNKQS